MSTIIDDLYEEIAKLEKKINEIQEECSHPLTARTIVNKGNTGNYDPSADCYWAEHHCRLCDKQWREDQ